MKIFYTLPILILLLSCSGKHINSKNKEKKDSEKKVAMSEFQKIIDSANISGAILIYDLSENKFYSNDFDTAKKGYLPASTFKIPHSIAALETNVIDNDSTLLKWTGEKRGNKNWEQDLLFIDALHFSCVPCYQEIARKIGVERMNTQLAKLNYGNTVVDSATIDNFWLEGASRISQFQQIDFLKRLYLSRLSISKRTEEMIKRMIVIEETTDYKLSGKTGWSYSNGHDNGWFVGFVETNGNTFFFATNVEPKENFNIGLFSEIRKDVTFKAFQKMGILNPTINN